MFEFTTAQVAFLSAHGVLLAAVLAVRVLRRVIGS